MLRQHEKNTVYILYILDVSLMFFSFVISYFLRANFPYPFFSDGYLSPINEYAWLLLLTIALWVPLLKGTGSYDHYCLMNMKYAVSSIVQAILIGASILGAIFFISKANYVSR